MKNKEIIKLSVDEIKTKINSLKKDLFNIRFKKIIIVSNNLNFSNYTTIKDCIDGQLGPLAGVLSAMKWAKTNEIITSNIFL